MAERQRRWLLATAITRILGLLVLIALILPATVLSAPPAQEQPGQDLYLDYGDEITWPLEAKDESELFETFVFRAHVPAGAELSVWLGEDEQGGCYTDARLFIDGSQVGYTTVGPEPSSWSEPIVATVGSGYAQLAFRVYAECESWVSYLSAVPATERSSVSRAPMTATAS